MEKSILAVCDLEETYARQLMDYLNQKKTVPFEVHAFTEMDSFMSYAKMNNIDVLLIAEEALTEEIRSFSIEEVFILSEDKEILDASGYKSIYKYQATENILREVMCYYAETQTSKKSIQVPLSDVEMIAVYSPVKRTLKTSFAIALGQILSESKRTIYINLEDYAGFNSLLRTTYMTDMSDLMYYISQDKPNFIWKLASMVQSMGGLDYIPPALSPLDIRNIKGEQWLHFFGEIKKCNYEVIILDMGEAVDGVFDILRMCKRIYMPTRDDGVSYAKLEQFEALLQIMEYGDVLKKIKKLGFSYFKGLEYGIDRLIYSDLGQYIRKLLLAEEMDGNK